MIRDLLEKIEKSDLLDFLEDYMKRDPKLEDALRVRFMEPEIHDELRKISNKIDIALDEATDYRDRRSWGYINVDTSDISYEINQRAEQGHIKLAFAALETLYLKLLDTFEFQEECEISDEAESCLKQMAEVADKATEPSDQTYIYEQCIKLAGSDNGKDYGADYEDRLLEIAARFVTQKNREKIEEALIRLESEWRAEVFILIHLSIIQRLDGKKAADAYIASNLKYPKVREIAYDAAVKKKDYKEAERLCNDALTGQTGRDALTWLYKLFTIYESTDDSIKMADIAERVLFQGDLAYYGKLKNLSIKSNRWQEMYPELLDKCSKKLSYPQYMTILKTENEYKLLLEQVRLHPETVYTYGATLAPNFKKEVREIFLTKINLEAEKAYGRESYQFVCNHIKLFGGAGYAADAADLTVNYKERYKRKPAFVDELNKIGTYKK